MNKRVKYPPLSIHGTWPVGRGQLGATEAKKGGRDASLATLQETGFGWHMSHADGDKTEGEEAAMVELSSVLSPSGPLELGLGLLAKDVRARCEAPLPEA
jgi:hypothetical protein